MDSKLTIKEFGDSYSGVDLKNRTISGKISTIYQDRDQEVVPPSALEADIEVYKSNPILILSHNHKSLPIGKMLDIKFNNDHVWAKYYVTKNPIGDEVLQLAHEGILNGFSSGFVPLEYKENPQAHEVPSIALKTSLGRKTKKLYKRCELVEVSLLAIPSNRQSLIDRTEKGNKAAGLVFKAFYGDKNEDLSLVLKELMIDENPPPKYTLKALWQENEHPRANDGQFSSKPISVMSDESRISNLNRDYATDRRQHEVVHRLDESIGEQKKSRVALEGIRDNTDWTTWFNKWGIRAAIAVAGILLFKKMLPNVDDAVKGKVNNFLKTGSKVSSKNPIGFKSKGVNPEYDMDKVLYLLTDIRDALTRGRELGLDGTSEYKKLLRSYSESEGILQNYVGYGLKALLYGITIKTMTTEQFQEEEHPRNTHGRFRNKSEGAGVDKAKATHVTETLDHSRINESTKKIVRVDVDLAKKYGQGKVNKLYKWAKDNKGKLIVATPIALVGGFAVAKIAGKSMRLFYSKSAREMITWDKLSQTEKMAFLKQAEPGDVFLQGGKPYEGFVDWIKDIAGGKNSVGSLDHLTKIANNGEYPHSALIVGHYDDAFHNRLVASLKGENGPEAKKSAMLFVRLTHRPDIRHPEGKKFINRLNTAAKRGGQHFFDDLKTWNEGKILITIASDRPDATGMLFLVATDSPYGGQTGVGAIMRTKVPLAERQAMSQKIIDHIFDQKVTNPPINLAIGPNRTPFSKKNIDILAAKIADPLTAAITRNVAGDDYMLCSGAVAEQYKQFGGIDLGHNVRYITPSALVNDKRFASMILEAQNKTGYNYNDWVQEPEKAINRPIRGSIKATVAGVGGAAVTGVGTKKVLDDKKKGLSDLLLVTKAMSKEEFDESKHPRAPKGSEHGGEFTSKLRGGAEEIVPTKGTWGGARETAGRLPKEAHNAVPKLKERFRKQNPDASEDQITQMVSDYAKTNLKPDYLEFVENPDSYFNKLEADRRDAMLTKMRKVKYNGVTVPDVNNSGQTAEIRDQVKESVSKWNRALGQSKSIMQAKAIFYKENATDAEKNQARLIAGAAFVASAIGVAALLRQRPHFTGAGFQEWNRVAEGGAGKKFGSLARAIKPEGNVDAMTAVKNTWVHAMDIKPNPVEGITAKIGDIDPWNEIYKKNVGFFSRLVGRILYGKNKAAKLGANVVGYGPRTPYYLPEYHIVDKNSGNYILGEYHADPITGLRLTGANGKIGWREARNIAIATHKIDSAPVFAEKQRIARIKHKTLPEPPKGLKLSNDKRQWVIDNEDEFMDSLSEKGLFEEVGKEKASISPSKKTPSKKTPSKKTQDETDEAKAAAKMSAVEAGIYITEKKKVYRIVEANLPSEIAIPWTDIERQMFNAGVASFKDYSQFLDEHVWNTVSRKTLALLGIATGTTSGMYYFHQDINESLRERGKVDKDALETAQRISSLKAKVLAKQASQADKEKLKLMTAAAKAQEARAREQRMLELTRSGLVRELIGAGFRNIKEGVRTDFSLTVETMEKMSEQNQRAAIQGALTKKLMTEAGYPNTERGFANAWNDFQLQNEKGQNFSELLLRQLEYNMNEAKGPFSQSPPGQPPNVDVVVNQNTPERPSAPLEGVEESRTTSSGGKTVVRRRKPTQGSGDIHERGFLDIVVKTLNDFNVESETEDNPISLDEITTAVAQEVARMISDMSDSCRYMIENGVPGHTKYEALNDILVEIYAYMKDRAKTEKPENTEISTKSFDKSFETPYMSTQSDSGGGMFTGRKKPNSQEKCPKCQSMATEETVNKCDKADCPYSFIDMIEEKS
jgi:hypothetical protein